MRGVPKHPQYSIMRSKVFALILVVQIASLQPCVSFNLPRKRRLGLTMHPCLFAWQPSCVMPGRRIVAHYKASIMEQSIGRTGESCAMRHSASFRTEIDIVPWPSHTRVGYDDAFFLLGSCFSENIGQRLTRKKLETTVNPSYGLLFNPVSAAMSLEKMVSGELYEDGDLGVVFNEGTGLWNSLDHHSSFSCTSREECIKGMNNALRRGRDSLLSATCIFITLGTAWVFRHRELDKDVANCHKLPGYAFDRRIVSVDEIASCLQQSISTVVDANPKARVILTVSPVRHWRDGPVDNARSKAHLLAGMHAAIELLRARGLGGDSVGGAGHVSYFPVFELINDDLRDYRFFEPDMLHPNSVAVDYIWDKVMGTMFSDEAMHTMAKVEKIMQATEHRSFNQQSEAHQRFLRAQLEKLDRLELQHPRVVLDEQRAFFESQIVQTVATSPGH